MKPVGAIYVANNRCRFTVWAPEKKSMMLHIVQPADRIIPMQAESFGYFSVDVDDIPPGTRYFFRPADQPDTPDPASNYQPEGVHGPSAVVDHGAYTWQDDGWRGIPFNDLVLYELHVGTFTSEGTFDAIIPRLDDLLDTGINAIEIMPVNQFPGDRNWGYDGVYPYAVQASYGGPDGLKRLVDACHARGMAVLLDVVYNHLGPEGNYFNRFGPYFTSQYCTPWGDALNFDGDWSDGVREFFAGNALYWLETYHLDGLRFDAIHTVFDSGAVPFWELVNREVRQLEQKLGRTLHMTAESDLNSPRVIRPADVGGFGFSAQWLDDFHHALYVLIDENGRERYEDFGRMEQLTKAYTDGFVHSGEYVSFRKRRYGASSAGIPGDRFIAFNQNHDQVGNRVKGERLSVLVDFDRLKLAAAALLLSPYVPLLFMGEEYGDDAPFYYFVSHSEEELIRAVQEGRKEEFKRFQWDVEPPDPQAEETFRDSKLQWHKRTEGKYARLLNWNKTLIQLRRTHPALQTVSKNTVQAYPVGQAGFVLVRRPEDGQQQLIGLFNLSDDALVYSMPPADEGWHKILDSTEEPWQAEPVPNPVTLPGSVRTGETVSLPPRSVVVFEGRIE
ncbi:malto-oligosyltrehalose trehalohydrolase [Fibrisoma montanum]|uniref:Malto-oligosyltrehalose trehalohydrolase n=1 Tax=Fibrisoma montanum TaxID=2305895 RepID=A0A418ME30_9BACT|nr:malto-oligosyltrehalose trehalohydrolase [Fibrisoma montanum]RIV25062.1 malto-oligosyltrehalose trehalohydrolase [Fibrisoma montanum]